NRNHDIKCPENLTCPFTAQTAKQEFSSGHSPGDLIETSRTGCQHWALYVENGYVIHLPPASEARWSSIPIVRSFLSRTAEVKKELLTDGVGGCRYQVNNCLDHEYNPQPVHKILSSAKGMIGKKLEYDAVKKNSKHFVTKLRYGEAIHL
ncbi:phospholipase A and acyltransferase 4-like, partial [Pteronotus mesoamericanus]|uniref:phospholipase A and acyltransferase 4-like n=1 Tax=Pteronotus mesoamericanus TaxID=1884717 RepID=UPI0023EC29A7